MVRKLNIKHIRRVLTAATLAGCTILTSCSSDTTNNTNTTSSPEATSIAQEAEGGQQGEPEGTPPAGEKPEGTPPAGEKPDGNPPADGGQGGFDEQKGTSTETTGVKIVDGQAETLDKQDITSTKSDESAIKVTNKGSLTLTDSTLTKKSGDTSSEEAGDFCGASSGILTNEGATSTLTNVTINTSAKGGNAVFSTGSGSVVNLKHVTINTTKNNSRGLDATYTGTINADDVKISTKGAHCVAVATDRGEGTVTVKNSSLNTSGEGSPCIYSTGKISASKTTGCAKGSLIAAIEGKNSISLSSCDLQGYGIGRGTGGVDDSGIMIYQSMSGDASSGTGSFTAKDSTLSILEDSSKYKTSPMFFITNTDAEISLINTKLQFGSGILVNVAGNDGVWGNKGSNGGTLKLTAKNQTLTGAVKVDNISTCSMSLTKTKLTSEINKDNTAKQVTISLDKDSSWTMTGDSYVTVIKDDDKTMGNILSNGYTIYYDSTNSQNSWLNGRTFSLSGGGKITPKQG